MFVSLYTPAASPQDLAKLAEVERLAWSSDGQNIAADNAKVRARLGAFAAGVTLATYGASGRAAGSQYAFQLNWDGDPASLTSWDELTAEGWYDRVHVPGGNTGFLVGVGVVPHFRGHRYRFNHITRITRGGKGTADDGNIITGQAVGLAAGRACARELYWPGSYKLSELLIGRTLDILITRGATRVIGNARLPWYHKRPDLSVHEYCALRRKDGKLFDPVLRFHERMGARILKPVEFSMEDAESLNAGCWVVYEQRFVG